ncbi:MAG: hypothetical protein J4400_03500 [Candidatus Aenigmarchaeota archaeon]|nr:hypothetical protein [Candidatus Aenigmarchaeota archaeon]
MYFGKSQQVKRSFTPQILDKGGAAFAGDIEPFGFGQVHLYRTGRTSSGLYVALRIFRTELYNDWTLCSQIKWFENYCLNAEELDAEGKEVPGFCIGVICDRRAGIFTEDMTAGGSQDLEHPADEAFAYVGPDRRVVYLDIDPVFREKKVESLKYFSLGKMFRLSQGTRV